MENRRITKQNGTYQVIKPVNNLGSTPERAGGDIELIALEFEGEECNCSGKKTITLKERAIRANNRDWEYYGRRYSGIEQITHLIRGTAKDIDYFFERETYEDFTRFLNNGSSLKGRIVINRNL